MKRKVLCMLFTATKNWTKKRKLRRQKIIDIICWYFKARIISFVFFFINTTKIISFKQSKCKLWFPVFYLFSFSTWTSPRTTMFVCLLTQFNSISIQFAHSFFQQKNSFECLFRIIFLIYSSLIIGFFCMCVCVSLSNI